MLPEPQATSLPENTLLAPRKVPYSPLAASNSADIKKDNFLDAKYKGKLVQIKTRRPNREQFDSSTGRVICTVSNVAYVRINKLSPCFYISEIILLANQEIEPCS